jgi:hypothetical protein
MKAYTERRKVSFKQATKLQDFTKKLAFWQSSIENGQFSCFPGPESFADQISAIERKCLQEMKEHLSPLQTSIRDYFPSISTAGVEWVILLFGTYGEHIINNASDLTCTEKMS